MPPWLCLLLFLVGSVYSAPVPTEILFPRQSVDSSPIRLDSEASGDVLVFPDPSPFAPMVEPAPAPDLTDNRVELLNSESTTFISDLIKPALDKWWCGNNTVSRGLAHVIAKMDNDIQGINVCCRIHDHEYDDARSFEEVHQADTNFDECLAREASLYRNYVVRPLYNAAISVNYAFERFKFAFKSTFLGGDGYLDLK